MNYNKTNLDCVIIGHNDIELDKIALKTKPFKELSGNYFDIKTNSVLVNNKRMSYMEFINYIFKKNTGQENHFNAFELSNLATLCLKSFLANRGLNAEIVNFFNFDKEKLRKLLFLSPKAVVITTTYYVDVAPISEIVDFIRMYNNETKIIIGGPYVYSNSIHYSKTLFEEALKNINADIYIIEAQGEETLSKVLSKLDSRQFDLSCVPNLAYWDTNDKMKFTERKEEDNILEKNDIDWTLFSEGSLSSTILFRTARGCLFNCAFCNYPIMAKYEIKSINKIEEDLLYLYNQGIKNILFIDDTFNVPISRFKQICEIIIKNKLKFNWVSFFRCSNTDNEIYELMKQSGCIGVFLGIESGSQIILNNMNKFADTEKYLDAISELNKRDIITYGSFIIGFPGETKETIRETVHFIEKSELTFFNLQLYFHDTIAPINKRKEEFGIIGQHYNWKHNTMDWKEASGWIVHMYKNVQSSTPLTLLGFGVWALPYLLEKGLSLRKIIELTQIMKPILIASLDDQPMDFSESEKKIYALITN